jgi:hypothetical protein
MACPSESAGPRRWAAPMQALALSSAWSAACVRPPRPCRCPASGPWDWPRQSGPSPLRGRGTRPVPWRTCRPLPHRPAARGNAERVELLVPRDVPLPGVQGGLLGVGPPAHAALGRPASLFIVEEFLGCLAVCLLLRVSHDRETCLRPSDKNSLSVRENIG